MKETEKVLIVDGHGLAFRAFYALPPLNAPDGTPTNAVVGFMNMLTKIEDEMDPCCIVVVFDAPGPTFRHEAFPEYKAQRKPTPEEFKPQVPLLRELLTVLGYPVLVREGVEADDVIASMADAVAGAGREAVIVSSDKDLLQILSEGIRMLRPIKGIANLKNYDSATFAAEYGFPPESVPDYLALLGDAADNVPGVAGVGEKTALQLIGEFATLENLYESLDAQKAGLRKKLEAGKESAFRSRELIRLKRDVPVALAETIKKDPKLDEAFVLCRSLGMTKLTERLKKLSERTLDLDVGVEEKDADYLDASLVDSQQPEAREANLDELLREDELAVALLSGGKYPPEPAAVELQIADVRRRYCLLTGPDLPENFWTRLANKKLLVNDYKEILACFGPDVLDSCRVWDLKTAHYLLHPDAASHLPEDVYPQSSEKFPVLLLFPAERELNLEIRRHKALPELMETTDMPLVPVLVRMERRGIHLSPKSFIDLQGELENRIAVIEKEIAGAAGEEINLNSPKQVAWLLFEKLGLPSGAKTKGKTAFSTSAAILEKLVALNLPQSEVPRLMLEHRELSKMQSAFVVPLQKAANLGGGVVHTTFEAALTGTGRLSSRDPNLQNLPAFGHWSRRLKEGLVPSDAENVFVAADYSQIELRVLAHFSGEERLLEAFRNKRDIHRETASWVFVTPPEEVTPELRRVAKMINFGLLYGMSSYGLADRLGIGRNEAAGIVQQYFAALPGVKQYLDESASEAQRRGFTRTLFGRIRPMDEASRGIRDKNGVKRIAINTPIQGTAADIARKAMVEFERRFADDGEVRLFLQIHDSLVCECPRSREDEVGAALIEIMGAAASLKVPLEVELKKGTSLADV